jgi:hypothetical protein
MFPRYFVYLYARVNQSSIRRRVCQIEFYFIPSYDKPILAKREINIGITVTNIRVYWSCLRIFVMATETNNTTQLPQDTVRALGVFANSQKLEQAINELKSANFPPEKVSVIAKDVKQGDHSNQVQMSDHIGDKDVNATGAVEDTLTAATWGSVLVGLSSLALPGLGIVLAAGSLGVALVTNVAGIAVGATANQNLVKALTDLGISEERARVYSDRLQQGYYLLILEGKNKEIRRAEPILSAQGIEYWGVYGNT